MQTVHLWSGALQKIVACCTPDVTCRKSQRIFLTICFRDNFLNGGESELLRTEAITS